MVSAVVSTVVFVRVNIHYIRFGIVRILGGGALLVVVLLAIWAFAILSDDPDHALHVVQPTMINLSSVHA